MPTILRTRPPRLEFFLPGDRAAGAPLIKVFPAGVVPARQETI
jgi:hypothetical protein